MCKRAERAGLGAASRFIGWWRVHCRRRSCPGLAVLFVLPAAGETSGARTASAPPPVVAVARGAVALAGVGAVSVLSIHRQRGDVRRSGFCGGFSPPCVMCCASRFLRRACIAWPFVLGIVPPFLYRLASSPCACAGREDSERRCCCSAASLPPARDEALPRPPRSPMPVVFVCYPQCAACTARLVR